MASTIEAVAAKLAADASGGLAELSKAVGGEVPIGPRLSLVLDRAAELDLARARRIFSVLHPECDKEYIEQFRQLRTKVLLHRTSCTQQGYDFRVVSVLSTLPGEGKTFVAANLAAALAASSSSSVLLIDTNTVGTGLHQQFNTAPEPGLTEALVRPALWPSCVRRFPERRLYFMPRGAVMTNGLDQINFSPLPYMLDRLRSEFDWIVLDGPAFTQSADAPWLAAQSDGTVMVIQPGQPVFGDVQAALDNVPAGRMVGIVMNQRRKK